MDLAGHDMPTGKQSDRPARAYAAVGSAELAFRSRQDVIDFVFLQTRRVTRTTGLLLPLAQSQFCRARFRTGHADFRTAIGNASTLPCSAGGSHFETLRKVCGM